MCANAAPGPEGRGVVAGLVGVGPLGAVAVPPGVNQGGVATRQRIGVEAGPLQRAGPHVGQEDVGRVQELVQDRQPLFVAYVEGDGSLAAVGQRQGEVDAAAFGPDPLRGQATVRVALRGLDVHHLRAPVRQQRSSDRNEHPLGQFNDPNSLEGPVASFCLLSHVQQLRRTVTARRRGSPDRCGIGRRRSWATAPVTIVHSRPFSSSPAVRAVTSMCSARPGSAPTHWPPGSDTSWGAGVPRPSRPRRGSRRHRVRG